MPVRGHRSPSKIELVVGGRLRSIRQSKGLSLSEVARRVGSAPASLSRLEAGQRSPTIASLDGLARALGVPITSFFEPSSSSDGDSPAEWTRLEARLRGRSAAYLRSVEDFVATLDRSLERLGRGSLSRRTMPAKRRASRQGSRRAARKTPRDA